MMDTTERLARSQGVVAACTVLGVSRSGLYRFRLLATRVDAPVKPLIRPAPPRALSEIERARVRDLLNSERFQDQAPREVYAQLLDEEKYLCSWRTMYRLLTQHDEVCERRNQRRHPVYARPELLATGPNQVWSWDITKLRGPGKGVYYYLYVMIDIFSRYVVGWMIAEVEAAELAEQLIAETCAKEGVERAQLTIHADNGGPMIAKSVTILLADLGVAKSHSRPHVPNDNPYSEAQFKTLKYRPDYPDRFGSLVEARLWARRFFAWYNEQHHHTGLGLLTPANVHAGQGEAVRQERQAVLQQAFQAHPDRFVHGAPQPDKLPPAAWINPPKSSPDQSLTTPVPSVQCSDDTEVFVTPAPTCSPLAPLPALSYTAASGTEDSATLGSDMSVDPADGVARQSRTTVALPTSPPNPSQLHCQKSENPKCPRRHASPRSAPTHAAGPADPPPPQACTLNSDLELSQSHCHIPH